MQIGKLLKVLVVDDEPFVRKGLAALIDWEAEGFCIEGEASNGKRAIQLLSEYEYDLVICDIKMPEMDGIELLTYVKENNLSKAKFIFLSGYYDFQYAKIAIQYACCDYILKPFQKEELLSCIRKLYNDYQKEVVNIEKIQTYEKAYLDRHLLALIWGKYDNEDLKYVHERLSFSDLVAYIHCEISLFDKKFMTLSKNNRRRQQRKLYHQAILLLKQYRDYITYNLMKHTECYNIGIIFCTFMVEKGLTPSTWLKWLQEELSERMGYQVIAYMGSEVNGVNLIADSYREAILIRSLQFYNNRANKKEDINTKKYIDSYYRKQLDELIHVMEINDTFKIKERAGSLYSSMMNNNIDTEAISSNIQYLIYCLLGLAYRYDADFNQEEIMQYIRETVFSSENNQGKKLKFQQFVLEYSEYLAQLRQNTTRGIFKSIEAEIEENYAENISLKSLGEKYYINSVYLGQLFKKKYGCTFKDYLNNIRIQKAADLLLNSDRQISQIAVDVGYKSLDYFIIKFEEIYDKTPLRFRKQRQINCD